MWREGHAEFEGYDPAELKPLVDIHDHGGAVYDTSTGEWVFAQGYDPGVVKPSLSDPVEVLSSDFTLRSSYVCNPGGVVLASCPNSNLRQPVGAFQDYSPETNVIRPCSWVSGVIQPSVVAEGYVGEVSYPNRRIDYLGCYGPQNIHGPQVLASVYTPGQPISAYSPYGGHVNSWQGEGVISVRPPDVYAACRAVNFNGEPADPHRLLLAELDRWIDAGLARALDVYEEPARPLWWNRKRRGVSFRLAIRKRPWECNPLQLLPSEHQPWQNYTCRARSLLASALAA